MSFPREGESEDNDPGADAHQNESGAARAGKPRHNVWQACKIMGDSRDRCYQFKERYKTGGEEP